MTSPDRSGADRSLVLAAAGASAVIAATSWQVGAVPFRFARASPLPYVGYYAALATMLACWLVLGRRVRDGHASAAAVRRYVAAVSLPLLAAAPVASRDLWAYAAQGHLTGTGIDPYTHGPIAAPGAFVGEMSGIWKSTPAPYGPVWLRMSQFAAWISDGHPVVAVMLLRLPAFAAVLIGVWAVSRLAGRRAAGALWLGLANPLLLVLGLGGGHNDLLMIALILVALVLARRASPWSLGAAGAVLGLALLIKSPAALAVPFLVPVWLQANGHPPVLRQIARSCLIAAAGALLAVGVLSAACGLGFGWVGDVGPGAKWVSWLSLPSGLAMLVKLLTGSTTGLRVLDGTMKAFRTAGEAVMVIAAAVLWVRALRGRDALACLAIALAIAAALAPSVQVWYFCWGIAVAALVGLARPVVAVLVAATVGFTVMITPAGHGWESDWRGPVVLAGAALLTYAWTRWCEAGSPPDQDRPQRPRPQVRAENRTEFGHV